MTKKILLTSFQTWLEHQKSNSSDDLLMKISNSLSQDIEYNFLRKLPVNIPQASQQVIKYIKTNKPQRIICCGMAEKRCYLTIESQANWKKQNIKTSVNLTELISRLSYTKISHDAGKFVCEGLYYCVLSYIQKHDPKSKCIFVHVPILNQNNLLPILRDMAIIMNYEF